MIDVAIIGFGFMGLTHAVSILKNKRMRLRAIITRDRHGIESKLQQQTGNFSAGVVDSGAILQVPSYTTLRECLRREKLDAVLVCVHTDLHYSIAQEAMENGLHVFLEKPITLRPEEAKLLIGFARQQRLKFMVGHVVRFMPPYKKLKAWIENGEFGKLQFISMTRFSGLPSWGQWSEKQTHFGSSGGIIPKQFKSMFWRQCVGEVLIVDTAFEFTWLIKAVVYGFDIFPHTTVKGCADYQFFSRYTKLDKVLYRIISRLMLLR